MKQVKYAAAALAVLLLVMGGLSGCAKTVNLESTREGFIGDNGVTYLDAPVCYVPAMKGDPCGMLDKSQDFASELYAIPGMDLDEWLAGETDLLFHAKDVPLPTLAEMKPTSVGIYTNTEALSQSAEIRSPEIVARLVAACAEGKGVKLVSTSTADHLIRFKSDIYPGIRYEFRYVSHKGDYYLYNRAEKLYYLIGDEIYDALYALPESGAEAETGVDSKV